MGDSVTAQVAVSFKAWPTPNFANVAVPPGLRQEGIAPLPSIPVAALDKVALDALAMAWVSELYEKAGYDAPVIGPALASARARDGENHG